MKGLAFAPLIFLAACESPEPAMEKAEKRQAREYPVGRFQMMPAGEFMEGEPQFVLLDTRFGRVSRCTVRADSVSCIVAKGGGH